MPVWGEGKKSEKMDFIPKSEKKISRKFLVNSNILINIA
jgi:hypothetical protein